MATGTMPEPPVSAPSPPPAILAASPLDHPFLITADLYGRMVASGVFGKEDRAYLWKGRLVAKMTKNRPHVVAMLLLDRILDRHVPEGWFLQQEMPVALPDDGTPEPDFSVIRGAIADYRHRTPTSRETSLIIEVSDTSLDEDRGEVLEAYASRAIPIYWIVNIPDGRIEVYTDPTGPCESPTYRASRHFRPGEEAPVVLDGREVARLRPEDILPEITPGPGPQPA